MMEDEGSEKIKPEDLVPENIRSKVHEAVDRNGPFKGFEDLIVDGHPATVEQQKAASALQIFQIMGEMIRDEDVNPQKVLDEVRARNMFQRILSDPQKEE